MGKSRGAPLISFFGRTYLDVEVQVPLASLAATKGKVDAQVRVVHGGFACNAARTLADRFGPGQVRVVTVSSWRDGPLLRSSLPPGVALDALIGDGDRPPISVIVDPARACRIFRDRCEEDASQWRLERVPQAALAASLYVSGRLPSPFAAELLRQARSAGARFAWCGGDSLPLELEKECDLLCVNSAEATRMLGATGSTPRQMAQALAKRARVPGAVRVVTGGGQAATVAAFQEGSTLRLREATPAKVAPERITRLLGVGDAFAARFLAEACFDSRGAPRRTLEVGRALKSAQRAAGEFITSAPPRSEFA